MKQLFEEFKKFIKRGNVLDMAIGVTVATAFTAIVTAFTKGFISPLLALLSNGADLSDLKWVIRPAVINAEEVVVKEEVAILYGAFIQALIDFLLIAAVLFFILKAAAFLNKQAEKLAGDVKENVEKTMKAKFGKEEKAEEAVVEAAPVEEVKAEEPAPAPAPVETEEIALLREIRDALIHKNNEE